MSVELVVLSAVGSYLEGKVSGRGEAAARTIGKRLLGKPQARALRRITRDALAAAVTDLAASPERDHDGVVMAVLERPYQGVDIPIRDHFDLRPVLRGWLAAVGPESTETPDLLALHGIALDDLVAAWADGIQAGVEHDAAAGGCLQELAAALFRSRVDRRLESLEDSLGRGQQAVRLGGGLPADGTRFVGRGTAMDLVRQRIARHDPAGTVVSIHAIDGMAGVGKTALAVHIAHEFADRYPDGAIFIDLQGFTPGAEPRPVGSALDELLLKAGVNPAQQGAVDPAALWRAVMSDRRAIVVLDNARDSAHVAPLLPQAAGCLVLITSRPKLTALPQAEPLSLDTLPRDDACALFVSIAGEERCADQSMVAAAVAACGWLPLAITLAAAQVRHGFRLADLVAELTAQPDAVDLSGAAAVSAALRTTFEVSYQRLESATRDAFLALGLFPGNEMTRYSLAALLDVPADRAQLLLRRLETQTLVTRIEGAAGSADVGSLRYRFHDLVRNFARERTRTDLTRDERRAALRRLHQYHRQTFDVADTILHGGTPATVPVHGPVLTTDAQANAWLGYECRTIISSLTATPADARLAADLGRRLYYLDHWSDAADSFTHAFTTYRQLEDRAGEAGALHGLADIDRLTGDHDRARERYQQAYDIHQVLGNRSGLAEAVRGLADIDYRTGHYQQARERYGQSHDIHRELGNRQGEAEALRGLADIDYLTDEYERARERFALAGDIHRDLGDRWGLAEVLQGLADLDQLTGNYEPARDRYQQAHAIHGDLGNRLGQANALRGLADIDRLTGNHDRARARFEEARQTHDDLGDRLGLAEALQGLANLDQSAGAHVQARDRYQRSHDIHRDLGNPLGQAGALRGLADIAFTTGDHRLATALLRQVLDIHRNLGNRHGQAETLQGLADVAHAEADHSAARDRYQQAYDIYRDLGDRHECANTLWCLGWLSHAEDHPDDAHRLWRRALTIYQDIGIPFASTVQQTLADTADETEPRPTPPPAADGGAAS